jgi:hypothetical protein
MINTWQQRWDDTKELLRLFKVVSLKMYRIICNDIKSEQPLNHFPLFPKLFFYCLWTQSLIFIFTIVALRWIQFWENLKMAHTAVPPFFLLFRWWLLFSPTTLFDIILCCRFNLIKVKYQNIPPTSSSSCIILRRLASNLASASFLGYAHRTIYTAYLDDESLL